MDLRELMAVKIFSPGIGESRDTASVPGVVSVITREQIIERGYRTLSDALLSIPGFSRIHNDDEFLYAPRGIYSTTNQ